MDDVQLPESLRLPAYRAARSWAVEHGHQQPDDRMLDAVLDALRDAGLLVTPPGEREADADLAEGSTGDS